MTITFTTVWHLIYAVIEVFVIVVISCAVAATMVDAELLTSSTNLTVILSPTKHKAERRLPRGGRGDGGGGGGDVVVVGGGGVGDEGLSTLRVEKVGASILATAVNWRLPDSGSGGGCSALVAALAREAWWALGPLGSPCLGTTVN